MFDNIEAVNAHIAAKTADLTKLVIHGDPSDTQYGTSVQLFAKEAGGEPVLEYTTYDPGTAIDSEHASLIDEAPDMVKVLHGDPEDITTIRVVEFDLADGVDGDGDDNATTNIEVEGEQSSGQFMRRITPDALRGEDDYDNRDLRILNQQPDLAAVATAMVAEGGTPADFVTGKNAPRVMDFGSAGKGLQLYEIPLHPPGPDTPTRAYTDAQGVQRISEVAMTPNERAAAQEGAPAATHPFDGVVSDNPVPAGTSFENATITTYTSNPTSGILSEAEIEAQDSLGQDDPDEEASAV